MEFLYVLPEWEGSAHDGRVLKDAVSHDLRIPKGKYYLGDAGYALNSYTMTPYRGTRYLLKELGDGLQKPQNKEELYNLRHSSLRNVIERTYGAVKNKFPVLLNMNSYALEEQIGLIQSVFAIYNFIRRNRDEFLNEHGFYTRNGEQDTDERDAGDTEPVEADDGTMKKLRDDIATAMWVDYLVTLAWRYGEVVM
ncbi:hypothetical protein PC116_g28057 [Phytophthora cactorum]|uniref:DDE Tnp4 domain-containing protein n=2 Tax=Phytophthora cactorum TaxID=29920 RepID=A0A8T0Y1T8_9STRA|nr:hypothetical protein PC111_g24276 [Phytophthora cactorum]KAG2812970.1 hypothetical protein PC113_g23494 [Phytophthora cactorum]KAG2876945.1 hypothetical protein PC115_g23493 [Phytophthora cactorum]KAG4223477.1 hypothetical protein PC116_g28057 [Phytophthora cactorum]